MFDTKDGVKFVQMCSRRGALSLEIAGMHRSSGRQTAYSICKEVYGFRGTRESVLDQMDALVEGAQARKAGYTAEMVKFDNVDKRTKDAFLLGLSGSWVDMK
jgi:hypothetical protein